MKDEELERPSALHKLATEIVRQHDEMYRSVEYRALTYLEIIERLRHALGLPDPNDEAES